MNLDFLDVLSQPNQKHREQVGTVGTVGTGSIHTNLSVPSTSPPSGNSGNKASASTANANVCSHVFPIHSQSLGTERTNVDVAVPAVPDENVPIRDAKTNALTDCKTAMPQLSRWLDARCAKSQRAWGSEKSLYRDYRAWYQNYNQRPCSRELHCTILSEWFQRDAEGWRGLCVAADWRPGEHNQSTKASSRRWTRSTPS